MGRKHAVTKLNQEQFTFVVEQIVNGATDVDVCTNFEERFERPLAKSSLNRWRKAGGENLADKYRLIRFQTANLIEKLEETGSTDYEVLKSYVEDFLLANPAKLGDAKPADLLHFQQEDRRIELRRRELDIKEKHLEFQREQAAAARSLKADRFQIASQVWQIVLAYFLRENAQFADILTSHTNDLLDEIGKLLEQSEAA